MTQAPERIFADWVETFGAVEIGTWADTVRFSKQGIEYIRADLVPQWQPIETAPEYDPNARLRVIVWNRFSRCVEYVLADGGFWRARVEECSLSHWMPLPAPPRP